MWAWYRRRSTRGQAVIGALALLVAVSPFVAGQREAPGVVAASPADSGGDIAEQLPFAETTPTTVERTVSTELPPTTTVPTTTTTATAPPTTTTTTTAPPPPPPTTAAPQAFAAAPPAAPSGDCHPSYDPCLPITGDLDCGDIGRPVAVHGRDDYRLDADGDGRGCERY